MQINNPSYAHISGELKKYYRNNHTVIDAGCGQNEFKNIYNGKIIGLNLTFNKQADFVADGQALPIKDSSADIILSNFVLEHVDNEHEYLLELRRALRNDGKIILSVPITFWYVAHLMLPHTWHDIAKNFRKFLHAPLRFLTHGHPHKHNFLYEFFEWAPKNYEKMFAKAGLRVIKRTKTCDFFSLNTHLAKIFGKMRFPEFLNIQITYVLEKAELL